MQYCLRFSRNQHKLNVTTKYYGCTVYDLSLIRHQARTGVHKDGFYRIKGAA